MAAFSYPHHPLLLDSLFLPNSAPIKIPGLIDQVEDNNNTNNTNCFSQFYPSESVTHHEIPVDGNIIHESSCLEHSSKFALSDNETSVTKKQNTESSTVVDKLESGEQVTQKVTQMEKKRKSRNGSSSNSAQSKDPRESKGKRQKNCNDQTLKDKEEKKPKSNKNDQKKAQEEPPTGYIHVRARRGQATDNHSLAERVRREKISERMKMLQRLVPGCEKVTGKALMLDEIINYVQSLQNQVELLSMKLASLNPMLYDFGMDIDSYMIRPEGMTSMALTQTPSVQQNNQTQPTGLTTDIPPNSYPILDNSTASLFPQQGHRPNALISQDNVNNLMWDVEDHHRQIFLNNNLCSFN
ncbi:hypothetical protein UlMin_007603 [Ulmus minor]